MLEDWSRIAEQIMLSAIDSKIRTLAITGATSLSGVSTVANGLATAFAKSGRKTLLIDMTEPVHAAGPLATWSPGDTIGPDTISTTGGVLSVLHVLPTVVSRSAWRSAS